ncbi:MAG: M48 family peptidase [Oxalobacteraceae bacterium]|nr:M48 family peptidase [Oxalobacteraceae bacterium]
MVKPIRSSGLSLGLRVLTAVIVTLSSPVLLAPAAIHAQALPDLGGGDSAELSPLQERKLGEDIMNSIRRDPAYMGDLPTLDYLNALGNSLLAATPDARGEADYDFFFFAVRDPSLNAFALPGGFIGANSGLVLAAQSESELASVMAHEIGHVSQRHIARMVGNQKQDSLLPIAGLLLGALAMRSSPDLGVAAMMGGTGMAAQRRLSFGRDAEREADRIGISILNSGGFETTGMVNFFGRLQNAGRNRSDNMPAWLRTHPLTTERIADIEARVRDMPYRQRLDSLDFSLVKARLRVLQDDTPRGWRDASALFGEQIRQGTREQVLGARYGMVMVALRQRDLAQSRALLDEMRTEVERKPSLAPSVLLHSLAVDVALANSLAPQAVTLAADGRNRFPLSRALSMQYAEALLAAGRLQEATTFLRDQAQIYRQDAGIQKALARAYAEQNKQALQHMALAEYYAITGAVPSALEQLRIARTAPDAAFHDLAIIDARERELQASWRDIMSQRKR